MIRVVWQSLVQRRSNILYFFLSSLVIFALFVLIPVWTTPGNDIAFQLTLFKPSAYVLMISLSIMNGMLLTIQRELRIRRVGRFGAKQGAAGAGIVSSSVLATVGCAACYSSLLSLFGLGGSVFIVSHKWWFAAAAVSLSLYALYHNARTLTGACERCAA
jgi:hypothetical protein